MDDNRHDHDGQPDSGHLEQQLREQARALAQAQEQMRVLTEQLERGREQVHLSHELLLYHNRYQSIYNQLLSLCQIEPTLDGLLSRALSILTSLCWFVQDGKGLIFLYHPHTEELVLNQYVGIPEEQLVQCMRLKKGQSICGQAILNVDVAHYSPEQAGSVGDGCCDHQYGYYVVPILLKDTFIGIITLFTDPNYESQPEVVSFLCLAAKMIANMIHRKREEQELRQSNHDLNKNRQMLEDLLKDIQLMNKKLEQAQEQVIHSEKLAAVVQLSAGVAHEIKNPLAIIILGVEFLKAHLKDLDSERTNVLMPTLPSRLTASMALANRLRKTCSINN